MIHCCCTVPSLWIVIVCFVVHTLSCIILCVCVHVRIQIQLYPFMFMWILLLISHNNYAYSAYTCIIRLSVNIQCCFAVPVRVFRVRLRGFQESLPFLDSCSVFPPSNLYTLYIKGTVSWYKGCVLLFLKTFEINCKPWRSSTSCARKR